MVVSDDDEGAIFAALFDDDADDGASAADAAAAAGESGDEDMSDDEETIEVRMSAFIIDLPDAEAGEELHQMIDALTEDKSAIDGIIPQLPADVLSAEVTFTHTLATATVRNLRAIRSSRCFRGRRNTSTHL